MRANTLNITLFVLVVLSAALNFYSGTVIRASRKQNAKHPDDPIIFEPIIDLPLVVHESLLRIGLSTSDLKPRTEPVLIIDGFTINDELDMLEVRLEELWDVVDYFIVAEAKLTFQNKPKPLFYNENKHKFAKYASKIIHVALEKGSDVVVEWENEVLFRNSIGRVGIPKLQEKIQVKSDDILLLGDIDEIPDHRVLRFFKQYTGYPTAAVFSLRWSYYSFLWLNKRKWEGTVAVTVGDLRAYNKDMDTNWIRYNRLGKQSKNEIWTIGRYGLWAGWHCSWCMTPESMIRKAESFSHAQIQHKPGAKDPSKLKEKRKKGVWLDTDQVEGIRMSYTGLPDDETAPQFLYTPEAKAKFDYMFD
jgi:beta-1,4-mannosyl-glycoprotein beta-1,4-N-acetylglucosaminyltransferase